MLDAVDLSFDEFDSGGAMGALYKDSTAGACAKAVLQIFQDDVSVLSKMRGNREASDVIEGPSGARRWIVAGVLNSHLKE